MQTIPYALAGEVPSPFPYGCIRVVDLDTGCEVLDVVECSASEGWLMSCRRTADNGFYIDPAEPDQVAIFLHKGRYEIRVSD
ncbi:hypothetical protein [Brevundimonas sp. DC300-4]|uniref:hypothetical protein n=1 Tax=Brevundimonas sp. DC300-4 TaxID=2804594 RepID=UPI003CF5522F